MSDRAPPRKDTPTTMADPRDWAAAPPSAPAADAATPEQAVAAIGGRALYARLGFDYDSLDAVTRAHLDGAAWAAFLEMWDAAIERNLTVAVEHVDADGQPLTSSETTP